jgi:hypothetical protein
MPTSPIDVTLKAAESNTGFVLHVLALLILCTMWGPFFTAYLSFLTAILGISASITSGRSFCGGLSRGGEEWGEAKKKFLKSTCCCENLRVSSVSQLFAWTALFAFSNIVASSVQVCGRAFTAYRTSVKCRFLNLSPPTNKCRFLNLSPPTNTPGFVRRASF